MANEMRTKMYDYVKWGAKDKGEVSKKLTLMAVDYDAEFLCQTTEPGQDKPRFSDVCKVHIPNSDFLTVSKALLERAVNDITKKAYKAREVNADTVLCDLAYISSTDFTIFRLRSMMVYKDNNHTRVTRFLVHKLKGWDDIKAANEKARELKNGSLGFTRDTCVFDIALTPFPVIQGNWQDAQDLLNITAFAKKLESMFIKPTSYGTFLDRVYDNYNQDSQTNSDAVVSGSNDNNTTVGEKAVQTDDEFPF